MYLQELVINGFKSFAKKSELEFSAPITAIVGPNGSGKSNVAESFRFVLGEQSVRSMRGKRGEDLIWGGSADVSRGNRAAVTVVLDNTGRVFPLDFDQVRIERVVHRDGVNEYLINGSQVRLKDVQELLANAHIGSTGHHIISQGEADRVLSASPKERREMIEDALGLKVYQYKKQEAERKLEKTRENIASVQSLRREHAPHLTYLKKQVERIEKSLAVQERLKSTYAEYLKREDVYLAFHYDRLMQERQQPEAALQTVNEKMATARRQLESLATADTAPLKQAEEALATARRAREAAGREVSRLEGQIAYVENRLRAKSARPVVARELVSAEALQKLLNEIESEVEAAVVRDEAAHLRRVLTDIVRRLKLFLHKEPVTETKPEESLDEELAALASEHAEATRAYQDAAAVETAREEAVREARAELVTEQEESREAERSLYTLRDEEHRIQRDLERIDQELLLNERDRTEFKRELQEAVILIQSAASQYFNHEVVVDGIVTGTEVIAAEPRERQRERRRELEKLKIRLEELGAGATEDVVKEYENAVARDQFLAKEVEDLEASVAKLEGIIAELSEQLREQFLAGISQIADEFNRFFTLMFGGGSATLVVKRQRVKAVAEEGEVEGEAEEGAEGVELDVALPNKRVRGLDMLSGGERALTSIALIFAMSQVNPPPFIILDETDAALDEANSRRYGDMIEALAKRSQLIVITHNRETMSRASILYGVTMGADGVSKLLSVKFDEAAVMAK